MSTRTQSTHDTRSGGGKRDRNGGNPGEKGNNDGNESKKYKKVDFDEFEFKLNSAYNEEDIIDSAYKYWKKKGNKLANVLIGIEMHYPIAPNPNEYGPTAEQQKLYSKAHEKWDNECTSYTDDLLSMNDHHLGQCHIQLRKKLNVEYTLQALEERRQGHIMNPLTLLKNIVRVSNGVTDDRRRELSKAVMKDIYQLKDSGQYLHETFDALQKRWTNLVSRLAQLGTAMARF